MNGGGRDGGGARTAAPGRIALARRSAGERGFQFLPERGKVPLDPVFSADQDMVRARHALLRQNFTGQCAQAPLHAVAHHRVADFLGDGDAEALRAIGARHGVDQKHKTGPCDPDSVVGGQKIGALGDDTEPGLARPGERGRRGRGGNVWNQAESFLRPRARRAASTLRPPTVAERVRNPWRRARTRLLGWKVRFIGVLFSIR